MEQYSVDDINVFPKIVSKEQRKKELDRIIEGSTYYKNNEGLNKTKVESSERIYEDKKKHSSRLKRIIASALLVVMVTSALYASPIGRNIENEIRFASAKSYITTVIGSEAYFSNIKDYCEELMSEYNISRDVAFYVIYISYGQKAFDAVTQSYGYKDADDFLYQLYPTYDYSSEGKPIYKFGSKQVFENNVQEDIVELSDKIREEKGISK